MSDSPHLRRSAWHGVLSAAWRLFSALLRRASRAPLIWRGFRDLRLVDLYLRFVLRALGVVVRIPWRIVSPGARQQKLVRAYVGSARVHADRRGYPARTVQPGEALHPPPPRAVVSLPPDYFWSSNPPIRDTYVTTIPDGQVVGRQPYVLDRSGTLLVDMSRCFSRRSFLHYAYLSPIPAARTHRVDRATVLGQSGSTNFFHYLFEYLPRVATLEAAGYRLHEFDAVVTAPPPAAFHGEIMDLFGVARANLVPWSPEYRLQARELTLASFQTDVAVPYWVTQHLRTRVLPRLKDGEVPTWRRVHISRAGGTIRRVRNQPGLDRLLQRYGFRSVMLEELPIRDQIATVRNADVVVAEHGAGLSHIVFCRPGTVVVELASPYWRNPCFWLLAGQVECEYAIVTSPRVNRHASAGICNSVRDFVVDVEELEAVLELMQVHPVAGGESAQ